MKNKFIFFIILFFISIVWYLWISSYLQEKVDRNSYATLIEGNAIINTKPLKKDLKTKVIKSDKIRTIWDNSVIIVEWWDWSITRLWGNSEVLIKEAFIEDDLSKINIWFELLNWKTWSNVISFLWEGSYFKEYFRDTEAAVRWTIFDINLDSEYIYVTSHRVDLKTSLGEEYIITENNPFSLKTFSFIKLQKFINNIKDKSWESLNKTLDSELFQTLRENAYIDLWSIVDVSTIDIEKTLNNLEKKEFLYDKILSDYQKLNFVNSNSPELFEKKLELKEYLIILASEENKKNLIKSALYDLWDIIKKGNYDYTDDIINILSKDYDLINNINIYNYIWNINIPNDFKNLLKEKYSYIYDLLNVSNNFTKVSIKQVIEIADKADQVIQEWLDTWLEKTTSFFEKIINLFK